MTVISNTSPLNYLTLIDLQDILPALFGRVLILVPPRLYPKRLVVHKSRYLFWHLEGRDPIVVPRTSH